MPRRVSNNAADAILREMNKESEAKIKKKEAGNSRLLKKKHRVIDSIIFYVCQWYWCLDKQNSIGSFKAISLMQNAINVPSFKRHLIDAQKHKLYQIL